MAVIYRPCYCTREECRRALEIKQAAYNDDQIDRAILASAEAVDGLTQRQFFTEFTTRRWDWPNYQYAPPWKLYLERSELAAAPTLITAGSLLSNPVPIPVGSYILHPVNDSPPYTRLELRRDLNIAFGYNPTPQLEIAITGPFGYWMVSHPAGVLSVQAGISDQTITVSDSSRVGVGDVVIAGNERMIVTGASYIDTGIAYNGLSQAKANDKYVGVPDGTKFGVGEVLLVDFEWILIEAIVGNTLVVRRAWDASLLSSHTGGTLWARRVLSVLRAAVGTVAELHTSSSAISVADVPALIRELAIAEALVWLTQEHGAYGGASQAQAGSGGSAAGEPQAGPGLPDLRERVCQSKFTRHARIRAVLCLGGPYCLLSWYRPGLGLLSSTLS